MTIELAELEKLARAASKWDGRPSMAEYREADEKFNSLDLADIVLSLLLRLEAAETRVSELETALMKSFTAPLDTLGTNDNG